MLSGMVSFAKFMAWLVIVLFGGTILRAVFKTAFKIMDDAIIGWVNRQLAGLLGVTDPTVNDVVEFVAVWGPLAAVGTLLVFVGYALRARSLITPKAVDATPVIKPIVSVKAPATHTLGHRFESSSRSAELILRNTSTSEALENLDVTFANFSVAAAPYLPVNVRGQLQTNRGETFPITLNAGDQRYVRFAHLRAASVYRDVIDLENVSSKEFEGDECVVKFRISSKGIKAKNLYLHIKTNKHGEIEIYPYRRKKE